MLVRTENCQNTPLYVTEVGDRTTASLTACGTPSQNFAFPSDTSPVLFAMMRQYEACQNPINVSFRQLVPWLKVGERATHYIHPYPAKLLPQIAHFFLAANAFHDLESVVLDPFAGTGTVALETILSKRKALYAEVNPLARSIIKAKTTIINQKDLERSYEQLRLRTKVTDDFLPPDVINAKLWYEPEIFKVLSNIRQSLDKETDPALRNALKIAFSVVARKSSRADPRFSVPVRRHVKPDIMMFEISPETCVINTWKMFDAQIQANIRRYNDFRSLGAAISSRAYCAGNDARSLKIPKVDSTNASTARNSMPNESVDLIITSPPYASAQKYVRATSLSLGWLSLTPSKRLSELEQRTIGREHIRKSDWLPELLNNSNSYAAAFLASVDRINPRRAEITAVYMSEMSFAVAEMARVVKTGGHAIIVIGDNSICGMRFHSSKYIIDLFLLNDFFLELHLIDKIPSRGLMTKRNGTHSIITEESILLFRKGRRK